MSPDITTLGTDPKGFPRVSGDEPTWQDTVKALALFSPRERG